MATLSNIRLLDDPNVAYIKAQIETGHNVRTKKALQRLCKLYRQGFRISPPQCIGMEQSVVGLLYTQGNDGKVRRWALNALARLGREHTCIEAILQALKAHSDDPQTTASAIAAIYRLSAKASEILKKLDFDKQMLTLAALQHVNARDLDLSALPVDVETGDPDLLQLALVVVGLDRAPENMLHPRHDNAQIVKALGSHHDSIVSQYTVWAITENDTLGIKDLGIDLRTVEQQPPNVRTWIFQLVGMTCEDRGSHIEYIHLGMRDPDTDARAGLALGLRDTYFDGLDALVLDWLMNEHDNEVSQTIVDHVVRQAARSPSYEEMAVQLYEKEAPGSSGRQRMQAHAIRTDLYPKFRRIDFDGSGDLFRGASTVTKINVKGNLNVQGGAVAVGGDVTNSGTASNHYSAPKIEAIQSELSKVERQLHALPESEVTKQAIEHVEAAKADPEPGKLQKVIDVLGKVKELTEKGVAIGTGVGTALTALGKVTGLM